MAGFASSSTRRRSRRVGARVVAIAGALAVVASSLFVAANAALAAPQFRSETWTNTYVDINHRDKKTGSRNVTLTLCASHVQAGANAYAYRTSTDGIHWSAWVLNAPMFGDFPTDVSYTLPAGAGTKRVYVVYWTTIAVASDFNTKAVSPPVWDTIVYDPSLAKSSGDPAAGDVGTNASPSGWTGASHRFDVRWIRAHGSRHGGMRVEA